jgi:hypothetical protein
MSKKEQKCLTKYEKFEKKEMSNAVRMGLTINQSVIWEETSVKVRKWIEFRKGMTEEWLSGKENNWDRERIRKTEIENKWIIVTDIQKSELQVKFSPCLINETPWHENVCGLKE